MRVWLYESGCYEQRGVDGVYATAEAAMAANPSKRWKLWDDGVWQSTSVDDCDYISPFEVKGSLADLVSALRGEGMLVVEKVDGEWRLPFEIGVFGHDGAPVDVQGMFDALTEAQPE